MSHFKAAVLFVLKSFLFSVVFICTAFVLYSLSSLNTPRNSVSSKTNSDYIQEYNRQLAEGAKGIDIYKELLERAKANMTEREKNERRLSAILDIWERQAKKEK